MSQPTKTFISTEQEIANRRNAVLYGFLFVVAAGLISALLKGGEAVFPSPIAAIIFLLLGVAFVWMVNTQLSFLAAGEKDQRIGYSLLVSSLLFLTVLTIFVIKRNHTFTLPVFYAGLFALPFTIVQCWLAFQSLFSQHSFPLYYLPEANNRKASATVFLNSLQLKIRLSPMPGTPEETHDLTVPSRLKVGDAFSYFIYDLEESGMQPAALQYIRNEHAGWQFFTVAYAGLSLRQLDPEASLTDNGIKDNAIIVAKRNLPQPPLTNTPL